jgi:hypothetical protein
MYGGHWVDAGDMPTVAAAGWTFTINTFNPASFNPTGLAAMNAVLDAARAAGLKSIVGMFPYPYTWNGSTWSVSADGIAALQALAAYNAAHPGQIFALFVFNEPYQLSQSSPLTATALKALPAVIHAQFPGVKLYYDFDSPDLYAPTYPDQTGILDYAGIWDYPFKTGPSFTKDASISRIMQMVRFVKLSMGGTPFVLAQTLADPPNSFRYPTQAEERVWVDALSSYIDGAAPISSYVWNQAAYTDFLKNHPADLPNTVSAKVAMSFPTTPVLDTFDRANNATLGANWTGDPVALGFPDYAIAGNLASAATSTWCSSAWKDTFGPNLEAYVTLSAVGAPIYGELMYGVSAKIAAFNGYSLRYDATHVYIGKYTAGVWSQLAIASVTLVNGDTWGVSRINGVHTMYVNGAAVLQTTDTTYPAAGYVVMVTDNGVGMTLNNFGGGTLNSTATVTDFANEAGAVAAGYVKSQGSTSQLGATMYTTQWAVQLTPPTGTTFVWRITAAGATQVAADTAALAALNAARRHRYAGSPGAASGSSVVSTLHGDVLTVDVS